MKRWLDTLLSELQTEYLKSAGYRKQGRTFSRSRSGYTERFNVQGSSWNGTGVKWRFYLNVGIEFNDVPPELYWSYFSHTHWAARAEALVTDAPSDWNYDSNTDRVALKALLAQTIFAASRTLEARSADLRAEYLNKHYASRKSVGT
ncbi:DUF4304 domain-containing protein [Geobacter sp.]|uniref:DUF4304 domain-containing protein n=1 Tax=Geobacter sp. TaxID=46610 RepID=UPI0027B8806B|nr:DUF4304 domain-containing protein [Geobacter sp.]